MLGYGVFLRFVKVCSDSQDSAAALDFSGVGNETFRRLET